MTSGNLEQDAVPHEFGFTPTRARYVRLELVSNHGAADQLRLNRLDVRGRPKQGGIVSLLEGGASIVRASSGNSPEHAISYEPRGVGPSWTSDGFAPQNLVIDLSGDLRRVERLRLKSRIAGRGPRTIELYASVATSAPADFVPVATLTFPADTVGWLDRANVGPC